MADEKNSVPLNVTLIRRHEKRPTQVHAWLLKMKVTPTISSNAENEKPGNKGQITCVTNWSTATISSVIPFFDHTCN